MKIYVSWVDKRHVVLRAEFFKNKAESHHFPDETSAGAEVNHYLAAHALKGHTIKQIATREWIINV